MSRPVVCICVEHHILQRVLFAMAMLPRPVVVQIDFACLLLPSSRTRHSTLLYASSGSDTLRSSWFLPHVSVPELSRGIRAYLASPLAFKSLNAAFGFPLSLQLTWPVLSCRHWQTL